FDFEIAGTQSVMLGVLLGLVLGKPIGIVLASWLTVRLGWCQLPPDATWRGVLVVGCLGGIGFTMSIFVANLAFESEPLLNAAKLGVLAASAVAAMLGVIVGELLLARGSNGVPRDAAVNAVQ